MDGILLDPLDRKTGLFWELDDSETELMVMERTDSVETIAEMGRPSVGELLLCVGKNGKSAND